MIKRIPHAQLKDYTTFQLGGPCKELIICETPDELITIVTSLRSQGEHFLLIGGGSNLVISDEGLPTTVIRYVTPTPIITQTEHRITVSASTILDDVALYCIQEGLDGLTFTSGIPGTLGGAIVGNAGAWGKQVGDWLSSARIINDHGQLQTVYPDYFKFSYRHSALKESSDILVDATFNLSAADPIMLAQQRAEILTMRHDKHPDLSIEPCAGSFFRNIEPTSKAERRQAAGWFLEQAGGKNLTVGGAYIYPKHANIIVKGPHATAQDIYDLHLKMIDIVKEKFDLDLQREVRFVGKFNTPLSQNTESFW